MRYATASVTAVLVCLSLSRVASTTSAPQASAPQRIDLAGRLAAGRLRPVNRQVAALPDRAGGVHVTAQPGAGVVWITDAEFSQGTIEVDVRGRDVEGQSFVGIAFHRLDDDTYEGVYLRPFNFRTNDAARREHAIQYIAVPTYDWPRLRAEFPEEFESAVDPSITPTGWVPLRVVVKDRTIAVYVGAVTSPALEVRRLGTHDRGVVGLWVGNNSDGAFADLRITPSP
jgi:hypothetical protein